MQVTMASSVAPGALADGLQCDHHIGAQPGSRQQGIQLSIWRSVATGCLISLARSGPTPAPAGPLHADLGETVTPGLLVGQDRWYRWSRSEPGSPMPPGPTETHSDHRGRARRRLTPRGAWVAKPLGSWQNILPCSSLLQPSVRWIDRHSSRATSRSRPRPGYGGYRTRDSPRGSLAGVRRWRAGR